MAGLANPLPGLLSQFTDWASKKYGDGIPRTPAEQTMFGYPQALARGLIDVEPADNMTPGMRDVYENARRASAPALGAGKAIFIGAKAANWNKANAAKFAELEKKGVSNKEAYAQTGTFRSPDGLLRQEIDDSVSRMAGFNPAEEAVRAYREGGKKAYAERVQELKSYEQPFRRHGVQDLDSVIEHPQLFEAYPHTRRINYTAKDSAVIGEGAFDPSRNLLSVTKATADPAEARSVMLHEVQHGIQEAEGMAKGGNPGAMSLILDDEVSSLRRKARQLNSLAYSNDPLGPPVLLKPGAREKALKAERQAEQMSSLLGRIDEFGPRFEQEAYRRLAGEAEARAVQKRMDYTPEQRRSIFPLDDYDVPVDQLIVRGQSNGPAMAIKPETLEEARARLNAMHRGENVDPVLRGGLLTTPEQQNELNAAYSKLTSGTQPPHPKKALDVNLGHIYRSRMSGEKKADGLLADVFDADQVVDWLGAAGADAAIVGSIKGKPHLENMFTDQAGLTYKVRMPISADYTTGLQWASGLIPEGIFKKK